MSEATVAVWNEAALEGFVTNLKRIVDDYADLANEKARRSGSLQDKINDQYLRYVEANGTLVHRMAGNNATVDHLVNSATASSLAAQNTEFRGIGAQVAQEAAEATTGAVNAALAQTASGQGYGLAQAAQTSAPAQGTTGVAQGALQAGEPVWMAESLGALLQVNKALAAKMAAIESALGVLVIKVTGEETTAEKPA